MGAIAVYTILHPGRIARESVAMQISQEHPALKETESFFSDFVILPTLPRLDVSVIVEYLQRNPHPSSNAFALGFRRMMTVLKSFSSNSKGMEKLRWKYGEEKDTAGNPMIIYFTFPVPRKVQLEEFHQCWVKCRIGFIADPLVAGDTWQMTKILGFFCGENCTLKLTSDCSHGVCSDPVPPNSHTHIPHTRTRTLSIPHQIYIYIYIAYVS